MWKLGFGGKLFFAILGVLALSYALDYSLLRGQLLKELFNQPLPQKALITASDFPPGVAAPTSNSIARIPTRPIRIMAPPRGAASSLLLSAGGTGKQKSSSINKAFGIDLSLALTPYESSIVKALTLGGDHPKGIDGAVFSVDRFAQIRAVTVDTKLKAVLLLSRSRGLEAIVAKQQIQKMAALRGKRIAVPYRSPARFFFLWELAQVPLFSSAYELVSVSSSKDAAKLFSESKVDAAAGLSFDLLEPARKSGGQIVATSADAPQLCATVLVMRSDFVARFPDAIIRLVRSITKSAQIIRSNPSEGARMLAAYAPELGDPYEAIKVDPPATSEENLAFFDLRGNFPVRYDELFSSAAKLWNKMGEPADTSPPAASRETSFLLSLREKR